MREMIFAANRYVRNRGRARREEKRDERDEGILNTIRRGGAGGVIILAVDLPAEIMITTLGRPEEAGE